MPTISVRAVRAALVMLSISLAALGCGQSGPRTYPIQGKIQLINADAKILAGSHIEAALETDTLVRASGEIQEDGSFSLQTNHQGDVLHGAVEGKYQVRIILNDDDAKARRYAASNIGRRFLDFKTSGISLTVPSEHEVSISVTPQ